MAQNAGNFERVCSPTHTLHDFDYWKGTGDLTLRLYRVEYSRTRILCFRRHRFAGALGLPLSKIISKSW